MRRTCGYITSVLILLLAGPEVARGQDTLYIPLKVNIGIEAIGPVTYFIENKTLDLEGYVSRDLSEKMALTLVAGYSDYDYSQYNYTYGSKGTFIMAGVDFNILKPKKSLGKYWGGLGLRYGLSRFRWAVPEITQSNYWGTASSSIPATRGWGHFLQASPGMRAELFRNISIGWSVDVRMLIHTGRSDGLKPIYFPGFGNSTKRFSTGISYYLVYNIPFRKKRVIIRKPEPQENEEEEDENLNQGSGNQGLRQQQNPSLIR